MWESQLDELSGLQQIAIFESYSKSKSKISEFPYAIVADDIKIEQDDLYGQSKHLSTRLVELTEISFILNREMC
jgi:hypothetical protein